MQAGRAFAWSIRSCRSRAVTTGCDETLPADARDLEVSCLLLQRVAPRALPCRRATSAGRRRLKSCRKPRRAFGKAGKHGVSVRDGLVAGEDKRALKRTGGVDQFSSHGAFRIPGLYANTGRPCRSNLVRQAQPSTACESSNGVNGLAKCAEDGENRMVDHWLLVA